MDYLQPEDNDRLLHEPRALWTVVRQQAAASEATIYDSRVTVDRPFTNGSRYPMTLTKMLVCPIGYTYRQFTTVASAISVHNSMVAGNLVDIAVAAPYGVHWGPTDFRPANLPPIPTAEPGYYNSSPLEVDVTAQNYISGAWGISRWQFDKRLWLPRGSTLQFDLSGTWYSDGPIEGPFPDVYYTMHFEEPTTGMLGGNDRVKSREIIPVVLADQLGPAGYPAADAFGALAAYGGKPTTAQTWPKEGKFLPNEFNKQETNRGQDRNAYDAFSVLIDQINYDEEIQDTGGIFDGQPLAPLSTRVLARARCSNGGSNEWWWRPGAPLALVAPTIGPALVYNLPKPIVLGPGENLEVEMQIPAGVTINNGSGPALYQPFYQIGLSFTGYASIELGS